MLNMLNEQVPFQVRTGYNWGAWAGTDPQRDPTMTSGETPRAAVGTNVRRTALTTPAGDQRVAK